jgi:hypothetical protein
MTFGNFSDGSDMNAQNRLAINFCGSANIEHSFILHSDTPDLTAI